MILSAILLVVCSIFVGSDAQVSCDVGEQEVVKNLCMQGSGNTECSIYCQRKYKEELIGAQCASRKNGKGECICRLKCCNIGGWGDPHYWTCDGVKFGYQGLKKHVLMKPINEYPTMPNFVISQINRPWLGGAMAVLDISELVVPEWSKTVEMKTPDAQNAKFVLKVDGQVEDIPYRYCDLDNNREHFINILFGDAARTQIVLTTSFGLRITYSSRGAGAGAYTDMSIDFPRHPELKDNSHGLLGRWNGNPADDAIDGDGKLQKLDDGFSWAFGESWIVREGRTNTPDCVRKERVKIREEKVRSIDPKEKARVEEMCMDALESPTLKSCAVKLGRAVPLVQNCITDLIFMGDKARKEYVEELIDVFAQTCKRVGSGGGGGGAKISVKVDVHTGKKKRDAAETTAEKK